MKQISRVDLEYDDMILFSKHFGPLYQKLKGGIFGKETKLEVVACRVNKNKLFDSKPQLSIRRKYCNPCFN